MPPRLQSTTAPDRDGDVSGGSPAKGSFFGRRKAKKLRGGQADLYEQLLPRLALPDELPDDLAELYDFSPCDVRLEIGFGGGEHLLAAARAEPDVGFIGCEPFINGMAKMLASIERESIANIRLWPEDAAPLLKRLPVASLGRIDLFYPDPWPKRRQRKRRFVSNENLASIARVVRPGGSFRFASDIDDYVGWTLARLSGLPELSWQPLAATDWTLPFTGWVRTRYEAKAIAAGRVPSYVLVNRL
ncbi:MAG: tRNA (guanine(46)-N(7))-methyltransferase TrmB [Bosea sp. (in: a-proteobacteria)]